MGTPKLIASWSEVQVVWDLQSEAGIKVSTGLVGKQVLTSWGLC